MKEKKAPKAASDAAPKERKRPKKDGSVPVNPHENPLLRHGCTLIELNPGQSQLIEALAREFAYPIAWSGADSGVEIALPAANDAPGLADFLLYEVRALAERQASLEALWSM